MTPLSAEDRFFLVYHLGLSMAQVVALYPDDGRYIITQFIRRRQRDAD